MKWHCLFLYENNYKGVKELHDFIMFGIQINLIVHIHEIVSEMINYIIEKIWNHLNAF